MANNYFKLGVIWGRGKPSFFKLLKSRKIVIGVERWKYQKGDFVLIMDGFRVLAIAKLKDDLKQIPENGELQKALEKYEVDVKWHAKYYADVEWKDVPKGTKFIYKLQKGIRQIRQEKTIAKAKEIWESITEVSIGSEEEQLATYPKRKKAQNLILYGPPGTGKTYSTIEKALELFELDDFPTDRKGQKEEFEAWVESGNIAFCTFHQSLAYEDFVEGIKPKMIDQEIGYSVEHGIFRRICEKARENYWASQSNNSKFESFDTVFSRLKSQWEDNPQMPFPLRTKGHEFTITGFTENSIRFKKASGGEGHTLSINTLQRRFYEGWKIDKEQGVNIYYPGILEELNKLRKSTSELVIPEDFILIIDEINRANVSKVFGELITLIEPDKRDGESEALQIQLANAVAEEAFSVPPNLHIVGTMNTADRSVEALDTALRRRFQFIEVAPKSELLNSPRMLWAFLWEYSDKDWKNDDYKNAEKDFQEFFKPDANSFVSKFGGIWKSIEEQQNEEDIEKFKKINFTGIRLDKLLQAINDRIEVLLDADHLIGHSYFMTVFCWEDLRRCFNSRVLPLLQEYFYGDLKRLSMVVGTGFVQKKEFKAIFPQNHLDQNYSQQDVYKVVFFGQTELSEFELAIKILLGEV